MSGSTLTLLHAIRFQGISLAIGLLPVSVFILLRQNQLLKKFGAEAAVIEEKLKEKLSLASPGAGDAEVSANKILFTGDYQNERLELYTDDLHLITSANNYIKLYHVRKETLIYTILRSSLKKAEEITTLHPVFFKCHRAYIINLNKVIHVEGNAQGYKLRIEGFDEPIPVSRSLSGEFSDKLLAFREQRR